MCIPSTISLEDVFTAYFACRKNKRNKKSALAFEVNYEQNCVELWEDINNRTYQPRRSIAFIVNRPVQREVFAADFRDRIVHHLIANKIEPLLEEEFIDETSNCRKGKGTHYGIRTLNESILSCSEHYTKDCWVLKMDIRSFFMSITKSMLCDKLCNFVKSRYVGNDLDVLLFLIEKTIMNSPEIDCIRRSPLSAWKGLPPTKSLFTSLEDNGIPIGNLTSQISANFFLNDFDHWMKAHFNHYGRYVDDFYIVSDDLSKMKSFIPEIRQYLSSIGLTLHPNKLYLQHYKQGVPFIGAVIKPGRMYISNRTRNNCYNTISKLNRLSEIEGYVDANAEHFACCINSYLGLMKHYATYGIRRRIMNMISPNWWDAIYISGHIEKVSVKNKYKSKNRNYETS